MIGLKEKILNQEYKKRVNSLTRKIETKGNQRSLRNTKDLCFKKGPTHGRVLDTKLTTNVFEN